MRTRYGHGDRTTRSGVVAYEIHDDAIDIEFANGDVYRYDSTKPGPVDVEMMKRLDGPASRLVVPDGAQAAVGETCRRMASDVGRALWRWAPGRFVLVACF